MGKWGVMLRPHVILRVLQAETNLGVIYTGNMSAIGVKEEVQGDLTQRFRKAVHSLHTVSNSLVTAKLLLLLSDRTLYARALSCFYLVHKQLDKSLRAAVEAGDADFKAFGPLLKEASRTQAFEEDLQFYLGPTWEEQLVCTPAVQAYIDHLVELQEHQPLALLAHSYTQHMSLLFGGDLLRKRIRHTLNLGMDGPGVAAFTFPRRDRTGRGLRGDYKDAINRLGRELDVGGQQLLIDEAKEAFRLNNGILTQFPMGYCHALASTGLMLLRNYWAVAVVLGLSAVAWRHYRT